MKLNNDVKVPQTNVGGSETARFSCLITLMGNTKAEMSVFEYLGSSPVDEAEPGYCSELYTAL